MKRFSFLVFTFLLICAELNSASTLLVVPWLVTSIVSPSFTAVTFPENVLLSKNDTDSLSDILYNTCSRWTTTQTTKAGCYYPHNAIIFFNDKNQPSEYIELCFDCNQLKYSSEKIKKFDDCDIAFSELEAYFKSFRLKTSGEEFENK